jgi:hypothetical protein
MRKQKEMTLKEIEELCDRFNKPTVGNFDFKVSALMESLPNILAIIRVTYQAFELGLISCEADHDCPACKLVDLFDAIGHPVSYEKDLVVLARKRIKWR